MTEERMLALPGAGWVIKPRRCLPSGTPFEAVNGPLTVWKNSFSAGASRSRTSERRSP
jgi:hypothetical protein